MIDHVKNGESELFCPSSPDSSSSSAVSETSNFKPTVIVIGDTSNFTVRVNIFCCFVHAGDTGGFVQAVYDTVAWRLVSACSDGA